MDKWGDKHEGQLERVRLALQANGLATDGTFDECLQRLMNAGGKKRKKSDGAPNVVDVVKESMLTLVKAKVSKLSDPVKTSLCQELGIPSDRRRGDVVDRIATALVSE